DRYGCGQTARSITETQDRAVTGRDWGKNRVIGFIWLRFPRAGRSEGDYRIPNLLLLLHRQQSFCLRQQKIDLFEWLEADVLPAHPARRVDQEGAVQGLVFEVVEGAIGLENL